MNQVIILEPAKILTLGQFHRFGEIGPHADVGRVAVISNAIPERSNDLGRSILRSIVANQNLRVRVCLTQGRLQSFGQEVTPVVRWHPDREPRHIFNSLREEKER